MKILVTGAKGFIGQHLCNRLRAHGHEVYEFDIGDELNAKDCEFVFHLAGINRPKDNDFSGNYTILEKVLNSLKENKNYCPIMLSSSIHAELDNDYGKSKLKAEEILTAYGKENEVATFIYRLPNVFGPGCNPNYNSVVATWCHNLVNGNELRVDGDKMLKLTYVDDVVNALVFLAETGVQHKPMTYETTLYNLKRRLVEIKTLVEDSTMPVFESGLDKKLYSTYLYYYNKVNELTMHKDDRGSFIELYHSACGQVSVNVIKPGITKGGHYHNTKFEMFTVVSGNCEIIEKNIYTGNIKSYLVSGEEMINIYMSPGWSHTIKNIGTKDAIVVMYASEIYNPAKDDTYVV